MLFRFRCCHCQKETERYRAPAHVQEKGEPRYCSRKCAHQDAEKRIEVRCVQCQKMFQRKAYHAAKSGARGPFCGFRCYSKWQSANLRGEKNPAWSRTVIECIGCGVSFEVQSHQSGRLFCSAKCFQRTRSKEYPKAQTFYNALFERVRQEVLERDRHRCVTCGSGKCLVVHHKRRLREFLDEAMKKAHEPGNLETVCEGCHARLHSPRRQSRARSS